MATAEITIRSYKSDCMEMIILEIFRGLGRDRSDKSRSTGGDGGRTDGRAIVDDAKAQLIGDYRHIVIEIRVETGNCDSL